MSTPQRYTPPKVAELYEMGDSLEKAYKGDQLNYLLSQPPKKEWVKEHPYIKGYKYLPIDKVEFLLRKIFVDYKIEITGQGTAFNGVWVTVRVHYISPVNNEWRYHDGIGACQLQTKKDTSPADLVNINNGALSMAYPIAKTIAIKDACDHFGDLFGANLNRKDTIPFYPDENLKVSYQDHERQTLSKLIDKCTTTAQLETHRADAMRLDMIDEFNQKYNELN